MRALVKDEAAPGLWMREVPRPTPGESDVIPRPSRPQLVTPVITHRVPAEEFEEAFAIARAGRCGKVLRYWAN